MINHATNSGWLSTKHNTVRDSAQRMPRTSNAVLAYVTKPQHCIRHDGTPLQRLECFPGSGNSWTSTLRRHLHQQSFRNIRTCASLVCSRPHVSAEICNTSLRTCSIWRNAAVISIARFFIVCIWQCVPCSANFSSCRKGRACVQRGWQRSYHTVCCSMLQGPEEAMRPPRNRGKDGMGSASSWWTCKDELELSPSLPLSPPLPLPLPLSLSLSLSPSLSPLSQEQQSPPLRTQARSGLVVLSLYLFLSCFL